MVYVSQHLSAAFALRGNLKCAALLLAGLLPVFQILADPPINDTCTGALVIPPGGPLPYTAPVQDITEATTDGDPTALPACQPLVARSIWYTFSPLYSGPYTLSTCTAGTTVDDTVIAIYTTAGDCSDPSQFVLYACADDSAGTCFRKAVLTAQLDKDTKYYILVWQFSQSQITPGNAKVELVVSETPPPENDNCANAQPLVLNMPVPGTTFGALNDYQLSDAACFTGPGQNPSIAPGRDVVYSFVAPDTGSYSIKVSNYNFDNELVLYVASSCPSGSVPNTVSTCLAAANRVLFGTAEEIFCLPLTASQLIYIYVDEDTVTAGSDFIIEVTRCAREIEPNDTPETATLLSGGMEGSIGVSGDQDYYSLGSFPAGSRAFLFADASAMLPTSISLELRSGTNVIEVDSGDNDDAFGGESSNIGGAILPDGPILLHVYDTLLRFVMEPYRLYAVVQPPIESATPESEPNDTYLDANYAPNNYFRGTLTSSSDVDFFVFNANAGDLVFLSLDCDPLRNATPINGKLELLDSNDKVLVSVDDLNDLSSTNQIAPSSPAEGLVYRCGEDNTFYVRVSISPEASGSTASGDYLLSISKNCFPGELGLPTAPVFNNLSLPGPIAEGDSTILSGLIVDPDVGEQFTLTVNWGDSSPIATTNLGPGIYAFALSHVYADNPPSGTYSVLVTATDNFGASSSSNLPLVVANVVPSAPELQLSSGSINEGDSVTLTGSFTDPGALDSHSVTIAWGDGSLDSITNLPVGQLTFSVSHRYLDDYPTGTAWDTCSIQATVSDKDLGNSSPSTVTLLVTNLPPVLSDVAFTSPVLPYVTATLQGNVSDPSPADLLSVEIDWGDGTSVQTSQLVPGATSFSLQHTYAVADTNLTLGVRLLDDDGGLASTTLPLTIALPDTSRLSIARTNDVLWLTLEGAPGVPYRLQATTNLVNWIGATTLTPAANRFAQLSITNSPPTPPTFYRALFP